MAYVSAIVRLVVVGDGAVGKTCLLRRYAYDAFDEEYEATIFDNYSTNVVVDGNEVSLDLNDTAGQEDYDRLRPLAYNGANVYLLCYSVISRESFMNIKEKWLPEVTHHSPNVPFVLVGCKTDLRDLSKDGISVEEGEKLAAEIGAASYRECSARAGSEEGKEALHEVFETAIRAVLKPRRPRRKKNDGCQIL